MRRALVSALLAVLLGGCAALPTRGAVEPSQALPASQTQERGRQKSSELGSRKSTSQNRAEAIFSMLPRGQGPLKTRLAVVLAFYRPDSQVTALARTVAASLPPGADAPTPPSGFQLLPTGEFAFGARIALTRRAEQSLDPQLDHLHRDQAGLTLMCKPC